MTDHYSAQTPVLIENEHAMQDFAQQFIHQITPGMVVFIHGDLGAGKTTLVRAMLREWGVSGAIKSPTYTIVEPYELAHTWVYHFDLYRLASAEELEFLGGRDYWSAHSICLLEWPEKGAGCLPEPDLELTITVLDNTRRMIKINKRLT